MPRRPRRRSRQPDDVPCSSPATCGPRLLRTGHRPAVAELGRLDILVNDVGTLDAQPRRSRRTRSRPDGAGLRTNLHAVLWMCMAAGPRSGSSIVNTIRARLPAVQLLINCREEGSRQQPDRTSPPTSAPPASESTRSRQVRSGRPDNQRPGRLTTSDARRSHATRARRTTAEIGPHTCSSPHQQTSDTSRAPSSVSQAANRLRDHSDDPISAPPAVRAPCSVET